MDKKLSKKIKEMSFLLMVFVVFIHSYNLGYSAYPEEVTGNIIHDINVFIQFFLCSGITRIAVPLFFLVSGYLFFRNFELSLTSYSNKIRNRIKTLVIPFLFWSITMLLVFFVLQSIPFTKQYFSDSRTLISRLPFNELLTKVFYKPIPYQLWFIKDLFLLILLSPLIFFATLKTRGIWITLLLFLWFFSYDIPVFHSFSSILFFSTGCFLATIKGSIVHYFPQKKTSLILFNTWILFTLLKTYILMYENLPDVQLVMHKSNILLGIAALWFFYDHYLYKVSFLTKEKIVSLSFFLFCFHEPLLTIFRKILLKIFGNNELSLVIIYFGGATFVITLSILVGSFLKKRVHKFYYFITGGR